MRNIIIITYRMLPFAKNFGDCQRMYFLASFLADHRFNVTVVSRYETTNYGFFGHNIEFKNIYLSKLGNVITLTKSIIPKKSNFLYRGLKKMYNKFSHSLALISNNFFNETNINHAFESLLWYNANKKNVKKILKSICPETIIISAPPFHLHRFSKLVKSENREIITVIDYRDPWNYSRKHFSSKVEQRNIEAADLLSVFSNKFETHLKELYSVCNDKIVAIYNGFSEKTWNNIELPLKRLDSNKIIFTYTGTYSFSKENFADITLILDALNDFKEKNNLLFRFIGGSNENEENIWKNRLGNSVEFIGKINHEETLKYLVQSDIQILLFNKEDDRSKFMITTKFFDYLRSKKLLWGIGSPNSDFYQMIIKYQLGFVSKPELTEINKALLEIASKFPSIDNPKDRFDDARLSFFSREHQFSKLLEKIQTIKSKITRDNKTKCR